MKSKVKCFLLLISFFLLFCCITSENFAQEKITVPTMNLVSGQTGGTWFPLAAIIADYVNQKYFEGFPITALPGGGVANAKTVAKGEGGVVLGMTYPPIAKLATEGSDPFEEAYTNIKAVCALTRNVYHLLVTKNLGFTKVSDFIGKRINIATGAPGSMELFTTENVFIKMGVNLNDVSKKWGGKVEKAGTTNRINSWKDRHSNVFATMQYVPNATVPQILQAQPANFVEIDKYLRDALINRWGYLESVIPAGSYEGQGDPVKTVGCPSIIIARSDAPDDAIYLLTKAIAEMKDELVLANASFEKWEPEMMPIGLGIEIHPGALKYYKERGWL